VSYAPSADRDGHADQFQRSDFCEALLATIRPSVYSSKRIDIVIQKSSLAQKARFRFCRLKKNQQRQDVSQDHATDPANCPL
jgi:hypothetical protein